MNRILLGVFGGLLLVAAGVFWWQGRAYTDAGKAPPTFAVPTGAPLPLPTGDPFGIEGVAPPEATEVTREMRRFDRLDRDRDGRITRNEILAARGDQFRKLDVNHDNLLTFEEWAVKTSDKFAGADANHDGWLSRAEFATTRPKPKPKPECQCAKPRKKGAKTPVAAETSGDGDDAGEPAQ
jgi:hypothetical protein